MRTRMASQTLATALLLASTALTAPAFAQTAAPAATEATGSNTTAGGFGNTLPTDIGHVAAKGSVTPDGITRVDIGGGLMIQEDQPKSRSTVTRDWIAQQSPTANPYQLVEGLPGANVASPDAFGLNGGNITIRGFNSDQLGLTIDGMPVNDSGNYALYPQEYVDAENLGQVSVAQGYSDLDSPHIGATGGVINIYSRDPSQKAGGFVDFSYGSNHAFREFFRLETGQIGRLRAYASYSSYVDDHWRGPGQDKRENYELKAVLDVRDASKITVSALYNKALNNFYNSPSMANFNAFGVNGAKNNYDTTYNPGGTATNQNTGTNGYYKFRINPFENLVLTAPSTFALTDNLTADVVPYFWYGYGNGGGASSISESNINFGGNKISQDLNGDGNKTDKLNFYTPSITQTYRPGVISKLNYQYDNQKFVLGYLYEAAYHHQYGTVSPLNPDGSVQSPFGNGSNNVVIQSGAYAGQLLMKRNTITNTRSNIIFAGDEISLLNDSLIVDVGVKQAFISRHGQNLLPSGPNANITPYRSLWDNETLPTLSATYKLNEHASVFAGFSTSFRTPQNYELYDTVSLTSSASNNGLVKAVNQKPEHALQVEFGHRYQTDLINTSVSVFGYHYQSRQVQTNVPDPTSPGNFISDNINAGSTTSYGVDFEAGTRPFHDFRPYISAEFLHATLDGDILTSGKVGSVSIGDYLPTRGKTVPNTPAMTGFVGVSYDNGHLFGDANVKLTGSQYATFMNDERINGYARVNAMVGYRFEDFALLKAPQLRFNVYNIGNQQNLTQASTVTQNAHATTGRLGSTIASSTPYYYVGQGLAAIVTLSSGF